MRSKAVILYIEDDAMVGQLIRDTLTDEGFDLLAATDGASGLKLAWEHSPSLILLDVNLPRMHGTEVCRKLKEEERTRKIPVIFLTARADETDVVLGLGMGAEDYIQKPFRSKELIARIRTSLRRAADEGPIAKGTERIVRDSITIDKSRFEVRAGENQIVLTVAEFRVLWTLLSRPGIVFSREQLLDAVGHSDTVVIDRNIDVHVGSLRKKLGSHAKPLITVRGLGYKWQD